MGSKRGHQSKSNRQAPNDIEEAFRRFDKMAVGDIKRAFDGGAKVGAFILTFVAIDCLATWRAGHDSNAKCFEKFVTKFFPKQYEVFAKDFYTLLRSGLVHNYSIKKGKYALTDGDPRIHLEETPDGITMLNWEDFFRDFLTARDRYYEAVRRSEKLQHRIQGQISRQGLLEVRQISFDWLLNGNTVEISTI